MKSVLVSKPPRIVVNVLNEKASILIFKKFLKDYKGWMYIYCPKDKELLHKNCADIYWVEDKDFKTKNKRLGLKTQPYLNGKAVARFWCDKVEQLFRTGCYEDLSFGEGELIDSFSTQTIDEQELLEQSCLTEKEMHDYVGSKDGYAIHISNLEIFDRPKELSEFKQCKENRCPYSLPCHQTCHSLKTLTKAPQNYCYVEVK